MTAEEKRLKVAEIYREIIGRNNYSQTLRAYCYTAYKDGKYYSDCSSSVSYAYKKAGFGFGILNTVGMLQSTKMVDVPVEIKNGQIKNPEVLRVGDMLLYAGSDNSRPKCVGHVEMVGEINGNKITLYGHGSGKPKKTEMTAKNKSRYNSKTATKVGNKGLICVRRFITDDDPAFDPHDTRKVKVTGNTVNVRRSAGMDGKLYSPARYVFRGEVHEFSEQETVNGTVWYHISSGWISGKYAEVINT